MLIGTLIFILTSIILYPFAYIALLYQNFIDIWSKGLNGSNVCIETTQFLTMIFKAPFMLIGLMIADTYKFIKSLYAKDIRIQNEKAHFKRFDFSKIDPKYFNLLREVLFKKKGRLIDVRKLIGMLSDELNIYQHVRNVIYYQMNMEREDYERNPLCSDESDNEG